MGLMRVTFPGVGKRIWGLSRDKYSALRLTVGTLRLIHAMLPIPHSDAEPL